MMCILYHFHHHPRYRCRHCHHNDELIPARLYSNHIHLLLTFWGVSSNASIIQWLEREKSDFKCPCCRNHMVTTDELREAACHVNNESTVIGDHNHNQNNNSSDRGEVTRLHFGIGRLMSGYRPPTSPTASPRRRTYSDESPIFIPDV